LDAKLEQLEHRPSAGGAGGKAGANPKLTPPRPFVEPTAKASTAKASPAKANPAKSVPAKSVPAKANVAKNTPAKVDVDGVSPPKTNGMKTNGVKPDGVGAKTPTPPTGDPNAATASERDRKRRGR